MKAILLTARRDPLILDLDGDGVETINVKNGANFDYDGNGFAERISWASPDDGLLVLDKNDNGRVDNGEELFGDQTILANGQKASNGFQALAELDANSDGRIDKNDPAYANLRIWRDENSNGFSGLAELRRLSELDITAINLQFNNHQIHLILKETSKHSGQFYQSGRLNRQVGEYNLQRECHV